jgi:hypothetical protein
MREVGKNMELDATHVDQQTGHDSASARHLEPFNTGEMQNDADRPTHKDVEQADKSEKQLHINP